MAENKRFVVSEHYVFDTKQERYAPFGEAAGAGVVADQLNANHEFARVFVWVDGKPPKPQGEASEAKTKGSK